VLFYRDTTAKTDVNQQKKPARSTGEHQ